jgi:hypothetical protein
MPEMMKAPHSKGDKCAVCDGGMCKMAKGGEVTHHSPAGGSANRAKGAARERNQDHQTGVHKSADVYNPGMSTAGYRTRGGVDGAKSIHKGKLGELKDSPKPTSGRSGFAEGGEVGEHAEPDGDEMEISHGLGKELMGAFEAKDHKKLMGALEACVLHCMSKGDAEGDE